MTGKMVNCNGVPIMIPNDITNKKDNFYISYNERDTSIYGNPTTALVLNNLSKFLILNGNHTKEYNNIINNGGGYADCLEYFKKNIDKISKFSDKWDETMFVNEDGKITIIKNS